MCERSKPFLILGSYKAIGVCRLLSDQMAEDADIVTDMNIAEG